MHGEAYAEDEPMAQMNFIPLIDIALTLVIILMVTTVLIKKPGVELKLPESRTREGTPETPKDLVVAVGQNGLYYIDGREHAAGAVQTKLEEVARKNKDARVLVKGDRKVYYERVMDVMDMARIAGLKRIILPTEPRLAGSKSR